MKIKKLLSVVLAFAICLCSLTVFASAEENIEDPVYNEGFMPTLPPCVEVDISVAYRPIESWFSFGDFGPFLDGTVLKVTYPDGANEFIRLEKTENEIWNYVAGDYYVYTNFFNTLEIKSPGINRKTIAIDGFKDGINYSGVYNDFKYLYIPSFGEFVYMLYYMARSVFNPIIDFNI